MSEVLKDLENALKAAKSSHKIKLATAIKAKIAAIKAHEIVDKKEKP